MAVTTGVTIGHAQGTSGVSGGSHTGSAFGLRFGEEVLNRLTLGMNISGGSAEGNQGAYAAAFGGLLFDATWQLDNEIPLTIIFGTGFGGGQLTDLGEEDFGGGLAGAIHMVGAQYDLRWTKKHGGGWSVSPLVRGYLIPQSGESKAMILSWSIGVETSWAFGRL